MHQNPEGRRTAGRPSKRWLDDIEEDLKRMGVGGSRRKVVNRHCYGGQGPIEAVALKARE